MHHTARPRLDDKSILNLSKAAAQDRVIEIEHLLWFALLNTFFVAFNILQCILLSISPCLLKISRVTLNI